MKYTVITFSYSLDSGSFWRKITLILWRFHKLMANFCFHYYSAHNVQDAGMGTNFPDQGISESGVGRRSRRTVSDRHSKDEDFVYFGIRRRSRQKSMSPTPSLQSNESESSYTSSRSSRSSRRNSGKSTDLDERKSDVATTRKRHASQELPSTSLAEERPRRARRGSPPNRYSPSESATQRVTKRRQSPSPTPQPQSISSRRSSKHEHYTRHAAPTHRDSDFVYSMPKRRSDRQSGEERPAKRKRWNWWNCSKITCQIKYSF